jgi:broad specificity phosphatase PhoE
MRMDSRRGADGSGHPGSSRTLILLVRHAHTDAIGVRLTGRASGVPLSDRGRAQLPAVQRALAPYRPAAIYSSPIERALATARAIAEVQRLPVLAHEGLIEVDFGEWTGRTFEQLETLDAWRRFNSQRGSARVPSGESAADVQTRIVTTLRALHRTHPGRTIVAVSHADVIRAAVLFYTGTPLDEFARFDVPPASVTALSLSEEKGSIEVLHSAVC